MRTNGRCLLVAAALLIHGLAAHAQSAGTPIRITHEGIGCVIAGQFPRVEARVEPSTVPARARAYFRASGASGWYYVEMKAETAAWVGVLPRPKASLEKVSYYVEVTGTGLDSVRTAEHEAHVVPNAAQCKRGLLVATVSAVGPTLVMGPAGAAAVPPGFATLTPLAGGGAGAGAAATAATGGGGMSGTTIGLLVGGVAAAGGAAAAVAGGSGGSTSPGGGATTGSGGTTGGAGGTTGGTTRTPQSVTLGLSNGCQLTAATVYAGDTLTIARGMCAWSSMSEAQAALVGQTGTITVDGAPIGPVQVKGPYLETNGSYCASAEADWRAVSGAHVAAGRFSFPDSPTHSCPFTVQP